MTIPLSSTQQSLLALDNECDGHMLHVQPETALELLADENLEDSHPCSRRSSYDTRASVSRDHDRGALDEDEGSFWTGTFAIVIYTLLAVGCIAGVIFHLKFGDVEEVPSLVASDTITVQHYGSPEHFLPTGTVFTKFYSSEQTPPEEVLLNRWTAEQWRNEMGCVWYYSQTTGHFIYCRRANENAKDDFLSAILGKRGMEWNVVRVDKEAGWVDGMKEIARLKSLDFGGQMVELRRHPINNMREWKHMYSCPVDPTNPNVIPMTGWMEMVLPIPTVQFAVMHGEVPVQLLNLDRKLGWIWEFFEDICSKYRARKYYGIGKDFGMDSEETKRAKQVRDSLSIYKTQNAILKRPLERMVTLAGQIQEIKTERFETGFFSKELNCNMNNAIQEVDSIKNELISFVTIELADSF